MFQPSLDIGQFTFIVTVSVDEPSLLSLGTLNAVNFGFVSLLIKTRQDHLIVHKNFQQFHLLA